MASRLSIGLAVSELDGPAWVEAVARALLGADSIDLTFVVTSRPETDPDPQPLEGSRLWRAFVRADRALQRIALSASPDPAAVGDLAGLGCDVVDLAGVRPGALDLVVNAAGPGCADSLAERSGAPVWWFDHDGHERWPRGRSGYAESLTGDPVTACRLIARLPGRPPCVLRRAALATHPLFGSENRVQLLWKSIPLLVQKATELQRSGVVTPEAAEPARPAGPWPGSPGLCHGLALAASLATHAWRAAAFILRRLLYRDQWFLLIGPRPALEGGEVAKLDSQIAALRLTERIVPGPDRFWADPHLLPGGDERLILVEEYPYATRRGRIAMLRLDERGRVAEARTVLERECHLSYPSVFAHGGKLYLVPESSELGRVDAYVCTDYPWRWEYARTLLSEVRACDSTIFEHDGRWWMFTTVIDPAWATPRDSMHVFFTDDPLRGEWLPHPGNPCVCDVRRARPAGPPFVAGGRLFRPGQDCSRGYGYGVRVSEVTTLTETEYVERDVAFLRPESGDVAAAHTLALGQDLVVMDAMRWLRGRRPPGARGEHTPD